MSELLVRPEAAETLQRRELVPTAREVGLGVSAAGLVVEQPPRLTLADRVQRARQYAAQSPQRLRRSLSEINPRNFASGQPLRFLWLSAIGTSVGLFEASALDILAPEIRASFGYSLAFITAVNNVIAIVTLLVGPVFGWLADRRSRIWMVRIGNMIGALAPIIQGSASSVGGLVVSQVATQTGMTVAGPAYGPLVADYIPARARARAISFTTFISTLVGIVATPVVGVVGQNFGWRPTVIGFAILPLLATIGLFFVKEPPRGGMDRLEMGASEEVAQREQRPVSWSEAWRASASIVSLRRLWYVTPLLTVAQQGLSVVLQYYFAQEFALGPAQRAFIATIGGVGGLAGLALAASASDRLLAYRPGRVMFWFGMVQLANVGSLVILVLSHNLTLNIVMNIPISIATVVVLPALTTLFTLVIPARVRGLGGQTSAPWSMLGLLVSPIVISEASHFGLRTGLLVFIPFLVAALLIIMSIAPHVERDIRAARAASMADEAAREARESGRNKMVICRDVDVTYSGVQVLHGIDFDVAEGDIVALLGTNGAGKSTLLRAICGLQEASNGAIFLDGDDITHVPPYQNAAAGVVYMPGGQAVFPTLTVRENLELAGWLYRKDEAYVAERTAEVLELFPALVERLDTSAGSLSGGEQQQVAIAQAFLMRPRLLMIDELSLGLAPQVVERLLDTIRAIHAQGTTVILVEQSVNVALTIAERAVFMDRGEIQFDGGVAELLGRGDIMRSVFFGGAAETGVSRPQRGVGDVIREPFLVAEGITVTYGGIRALSDVSVAVTPGEIVGIVGPNGAGKTTLFDALSGFVSPDAGSVRLAGEDATRLDAAERARRGLGRSFQDVRLFPSMTVRENIAVALYQRAKARNVAAAAVWAPSVRRDERAVRIRVDELIDLLGLAPYADRYMDELSTGTRRTVDIACVLAVEPQVLLLDEPTSGLAQAETEELGPVLQRLVRETGCGLLVIEHDLALLATISDRMVAMETGQVVTEGLPDAVLSDPQVLSSYIAGSEDVLVRSGNKALADIVGRLPADRS